MNDKSGSLLIITLLSVATASILTLSLGIYIRTALTISEKNAALRTGRQACLNAAQAAVCERLGSADALEEEWGLPWETQIDGWTMRVTADGWKSDAKTQKGLVDESGKIPLSIDRPDIFASLLRLVTGADRKEFEQLGLKIAKHDCATVEQLREIEGMDEPLFRAIAPYVTTVSDGRININTVSRTVALAVFRCVRGHDKAAESLFARISAFRDSGGHFASASPDLLARALGSPPEEETAILRLLRNHISVSSEYFSGVVEASASDFSTGGKYDAKALFIFNRTTARFVKWVEL